MNEMGNKNNSVWLRVVGMLLLAASALVTQLPLDKQRPPAREEGERTPNKVEARLWQDPVGVVLQYLKSKEKCGKTNDYELALSNTPTGKGLLINCKERKKDEPFFETLNKEISKQEIPPMVMGVLVSFSAAVGEEEWRRRVRYAVLSGFKERGYVPEDAEYINFIDLRGFDNSLGFPEIIPYEWMKPSEDSLSNKKRFLLFWLNENALTSEDFTDKPLPNRLVSILSYIYGQDNADKQPGMLPIIGPSSSDELNRLIQQDYASNFQCNSENHMLLPDYKVLNFIPRYQTNIIAEFFCQPFVGVSGKADITFYSPWATAYKLENKLPDNVTINHMISEDRALIPLLLDELKKRGIKKSENIALISQWDTGYARRLTQGIKEELLPKGFCSHDNNDSKKECADLTSFTYFRGLDGRFIENDNKSINADKSLVLSEKKDVVDRSVGDAQTDYLLRIRDNLLERDKMLRKQHPLDHGIHAIGIIGDDYYDKLLILSALRPTFPDAIFFTTDLNANMLHPSDNKWTRNMLVASAYNLILDDDYQGNTPPFRDAYQTATFLAVQTALGQFSEKKGLSKYWQLQPRIFEIGRSAAIDLQFEGRLDRDGDHSQCTAMSRKGCISPQLSQKKHTRIGTDLWYFCPTFFLLGCLLYINRKWRTSFAFFNGMVKYFKRVLRILRGKRRRIIIITLLKAKADVILYFWIVLLALIFIYSLSLIDERLYGEPFLLIQGVNIWPSEFIRLIAGALSIIWFVESRKELKGVINNIDQKLFKAPYPALKSESATNEATVYWKSFVDYWSSDQLYFLIFIQAILFFVSICFIMLILGFPSIPARGEFAFNVDLCVVIFSVFSFLALLFLVSNITTQACQLAANLRGLTVWPQHTLHKFGLLNKNSHIHMEDFLDITLIATCTETIVPMVYRPIYALCLLVIARSQIFDNWTVPISLQIAYGLMLIIAINSAFQLHRTAENARNAALERQRSYLVYATSNENLKDYVLQLQTSIAHIEGIQTGAFAPFWQQPVITAIFILLAVITGTNLLDLPSMMKLLGG